MNIRLTVFVAACAAFFSSPVTAHTGHTEMVAGHTHSLLDLTLMSAGLAIVVAAGIGLAIYWIAKRNG
jgi:hypothetical protein